MPAEFEPVSLADLKKAFAQVLPGQLDDNLSRLTGNPGSNTLATVGLTSVLFYLAERGHNPKVNSIWDATIYCSTCLSVGYGDIFAKTNLGKMIGTLLMTLGPGIVGKALDGAAPTQDTQQQILAALQQILAELEKQRPSPPPASP